MSRICQRCSNPNTDEAKFCLHCGNMLEVAVQDAGDALIGKIILGRYRIASLLGEGGMGKVYLAEQKMGTATRKVAIKTLHPELGSDPQLVARFHRECETVIQLSHPNTVQFFDFGEMEDGTLFIVMEYIEGESLAHVLQRGAIDPARADKILIQICGSLHEAHQRGVVHRDLKPENVLLTDRGGQTDFVKVLDFGIAKRSEAEDESKAKLTKQGMVLGTPPYMSPEQFSGQALDARSDIYSLGIMTYEMLTGRLPFEARTPWEWATKHLTEQPKPIEAHVIAGSLPERKKTALRRALAKNRDDRQPTVLEFLHEFTGIQDAQAAWTMATASSSATGAPRPQSQQPRAPVGTPGPMPQAAGFPPPATPRPFNQPTPAPIGGSPYATPQGGFPRSHAGYPSSQVEAQPTGGGGLGKVLVILVLLFFVLSGGAAGAIYVWTQQTDPVADVRPTPPPIGTPTPIPTPIPTPHDNILVPQDPRPNEIRPDPIPNTNIPTTPDVVEPDEPDEPDEREPPSGGPSPEDLRRGRDAIAQASAALGRNDIAAAVNSLSVAQRALGRAHPQVRDARNDLARRASNHVGILMQQGRCADAQNLYRQLRRVGADSSSRQHFSPDWCRRP